MPRFALQSAGHRSPGRRADDVDEPVGHQVQHQWLRTSREQSVQHGKAAAGARPRKAPTGHPPAHPAAFSPERTRRDRDTILKTGWRTATPFGDLDGLGPLGPDHRPRPATLVRHPPGTLQVTGAFARPRLPRPGPGGRRRRTAGGVYSPGPRRARVQAVWSSTLASGAFFCTEAMPFRTAVWLWYASPRGDHLTVACRQAEPELAGRVFVHLKLARHDDSPSYADRDATTVKPSQPTDCADSPSRP